MITVQAGYIFSREAGGFKPRAYIFKGELLGTMTNESALVGVI